MVKADHMNGLFPSDMSPAGLAAYNLTLLFLLKLASLLIGFLTIRLGYVLLQSGAKGEFKFSGKIGGASADLASMSPGLLFVLLGVALIGYAVFVEKIIELRIPTEQAVTVPDAPLPSVQTAQPKIMEQ